MIDFYVKGSIDSTFLKSYLSFVFNVNKEKIYITQSSEIENFKVLDYISCLALISEIQGDVDYLIEIYRSEIEFETFIMQTQTFANQVSQTFYVPFDNFDGFYQIQSNSPLIKLKLYEDENGKVFYIY